MVKNFGSLKLLYHLKTWTDAKEIAQEFWNTPDFVSSKNVDRGTRNCVEDAYVGLRVGNHHFFSYCVEEAFACWGLEKDDEDDYTTDVVYHGHNIN